MSNKNNTEIKESGNLSDYSDESEYEDEDEILDDQDDDENDEDDPRDEDEDEDNDENRSEVDPDDDMDDVLEEVDLNEDIENVNYGDGDNNDLEEDYDEDDINYQKFENYSVIENLEESHPEIRSANMDEIKVLSKVVRNDKGDIVDGFHTTAPFLTKYEKARIIGTRAEQIERGAPSFIKDLDENIIHGRTIAIEEFEKKLIPFIIARPLPNKKVEYWKLQDLEIL